jgi:GT2 family glycosyltransferase
MQTEAFRAHAQPEPVAADISVVVVNWNTRDLLAQCLQSVAEHVPTGLSTQVVVVDNASTDGSIAYMRCEWPDVLVIANDTNVGYQRANNQAFPHCRGEQLLLINADAMLTPGCIDAMRALMASDPRAAVIGPRLVYPDGRWQRWTAGHRLDTAAAVVSLLGADRVLARRGLWLGRDVKTPFPAHWVSSACMLVRRRALDEIGPMDERFFAYMDDVDLCERAIEAGWHVWYEPRAEAIHVMGARASERCGTTSPLALRNLYRYVEVHHGASAGRKTRAAGVVGFTMRAVAHGAVGLIRTGHRQAAHSHWQNARLSVAYDSKETGRP